MWKLLKISEQTYFIYCNINTKQHVTFLLYDLETTWSQTLSVQEVKQKVKFLNKRFDFSMDNIKEALTSDEIQSASIEEQPHTRALNTESCLLKLKYRVKNCILNYEWNLKKQTLVKFQQTFVQPLLLALLGCHQQVEILSDSISKKDMELKQFRIEGIELNRKTLVTKPFDFENFKKKYQDCNKTAINFKELAKYIEDTVTKAEPEIKNKTLNVNKVEQDIMSEENLSNKQNANTKMSPKHKKRKVNEVKMQYLEEHLKIRRKGLEYESSQSQTPSGDSQTIEEIEMKDSYPQKERTTKQNATSKSETILSPRKSIRCAFMKQKPDKMSSEDKTDSEVEDHLRTLRERTIRSLANSPKDSSTNSTKKQTKTYPKSNAEATTRNLSYKFQNKSPETSHENSNVFDFSTDSEYDLPLVKMKDTIEKDGQLLKGKKLLPNKGLLSSNEEGESMVHHTPAVLECMTAKCSISLESPSQSKTSSQLTTPVVIKEISSQLDNIRKELESLEAMRLADLKQRTCKV